jgi:methionyl-tRNA formyltransferase
VTAFRVVERMDAGEIFSRRQAQIGPDDTAQELHDRLAELGVEAVLETLEQLAAGQSTGQPQDESRVTRAPKLKKSDGEVDFSADAVTIRNLIHGSWPWPGGQGRYVSAEGKPADVIIARARALEGPVPPAEPGAVLDDLTIAAGAGRLQILQLKPAGRKLIGWRDFVNGYRVRPGARFTHVRR